ncbi:MAG: ComEC/Rec2 family competence protein [Anaerolineae bacterium]|nr:ComEC/Rec2 family competence protein [Anaerolineae bacterium]
MRLIYLALGWAGGILLAANTTNRPIMVWVGLVLVALLLAWFTRRDDELFPFKVMLIGFTLGGLRFAFVPVSSDVAQYNNLGGLTIEGVVVAEPDARDDRLELRVEAESVTRIGQTIPTSGLVLIQAPPTANVHYGDRIMATGLLVVPGEGDTFSYADFLGRNGVFSLMRDTAVEVISTGHGDAWYSALLDLKARAAESIARALPEPNAALLTGILLGNDRGLSPDVANAFSRVGASHIIAISGFNMAILSGTIMGLLERIRIRGRWAALIGITVIGLYTILVGANAAVVRSALMSSMLVIGALIRRKTYVPASIGFVALVLSALNPTILWDVGFQLSLFATLGLALFATPLSKWFNWMLLHVLPHRVANLVGSFLNDALVVSVAAQILTLPLIVLYFGRLSVVVLLVNLLIIPAQTLLLILGLAATLLALIVPGLAQLLYWLDMLLLSYTLGVVRLFAGLPFADVEFHVDARLITLFFVVVMGGALMQATQPTWAVRLGRFIRRRAVIAAVSFAGVGLAALLVAVALSRPDGQLHVWLLDVGHSNAVLVQTPGGAHMLVDGGRFPSRLLTALGDRLPFNKREIDVLVITQPDEFDYGALSAVLERYSVGVVLTNGHPNLNPVYEALQSRLSAYPQVTVRAGYNLEFGDGTRLEVLHPQSEPTLDDPLNDQSLVLRLIYGESSFLLTGDLSQEGQMALLEGGQWPLASVLQLPEHGRVRSLSEAFLQAAQPQVAVVQADRANRFGDPDADTLRLLGDVPVFRTDQSGTIHLYTDGQSLWVVGMS